MISVDRVYKTLLRLANSDIRGNNTPEEIKVFILDAVNNIYEGYFADITRAINRQNRGLTGSFLENITERIREKILHFLVEDVELTFADPYFTLPENLMYIDTVYFRDREIDLCSNSKEFKMVASNVDTSPSTTYPIGLKVGSELKIAPDTIVEDVKLSYLRKPVVANWAYNVISGAPVVNFDAADYRDIDLHPSEEGNLVVRVAKRMGINLEDPNLMQYGMNSEQQDFNQDNAS